MSKKKSTESSKGVVQTRFLELLAKKGRLEGRRITYRDVIEETGISKSSVQKWATNKLTRFDELQIVTFCDYFDCDIADLLVLNLSEDDSQGQIKETLVA